MAITAYSATRIGGATEVTVTSGLSGTIYYHWYQDGVWLGMTRVPRFTLWLDAGEQVDLVCQDTNDADYDGPANAPDGWPARRTIWWLRSVATDVAAYRVEQQLDGGAWSTAGTVDREGELWEYSFLTDRLDDLSVYDWRVIPVDDAGNDGTALDLEAETVVRKPDAPDFETTYDDGTNRVTFIAA